MMAEESQAHVIGAFDIKKKYMSFNLAIKADLKPGITAVFGNSGSGKTTLLNCLSGLTQPDEGYVRLDGQELFDSDLKINVKPEKRRIGYVLQDSLIFHRLCIQSQPLLRQPICLSESVTCHALPNRYRC